MTETPTEYVDHLPPSDGYIVRLAQDMYSLYCHTVGGKAFNGDPLPKAEEFFADPNKKLQAQGWVNSAAHAVANSAFWSVAHMNESFGNHMGDYHNIDWNVVERQVKMLKSEVQELEDALKAQDKKKVLDAFGDINVVSYGGMHRMGVNGDYIMSMIYYANMSKFIKDEKELVDTKLKYDIMGVKYTVEGEFPTKFLRCAETVVIDGDEYLVGKFLKGINFKEPTFDELTRASQK